MGLPARWVTNPAHQLTQNQQITALGNGVDEYNHHRRHSSLGYLPPVEYARQCNHQMETDDSQSVRTE